MKTAIVIFDKQKYKLLYDLYFVFWQVLPKLLVPELPELPELLELLELLELPERLELPELRERRERLELLFKKNKDEIIKTLQPIEDFLKKMKLLQEKLPNCKMWY